MMRTLRIVGCLLVLFFVKGMCVITLDQSVVKPLKDGNSWIPLFISHKSIERNQIRIKNQNPELHIKYKRKWTEQHKHWSATITTTTYTETNFLKNNSRILDLVQNILGANVSYQNSPYSVGFKTKLYGT